MNKRCLANIEIRNLKTNPRMVTSRQANKEVIVYHCGLSCDCTYFRTISVETAAEAIQEVIKRHNRTMFELKRNRDRETNRRINTIQARDLPRSAPGIRWTSDWIRAVDNQPVVRVATPEEMRRLHGGGL